MHRYTNAKHANSVLLIWRERKCLLVNKSRDCTILCSIYNPLVFVMLFLPLQKFCDTFRCPYRVLNVKRSLVHISRWRPSNFLRSDIFLSGIIPCTSYEQPLHFLPQYHAWNACRQALHSCDEASRSKSMQRMTTDARKWISCTGLNSTLYCSNIVFFYISLRKQLTYLPSICLYISNI